MESNQAKFLAVVEILGILVQTAALPTPSLIIKSDLELLSLGY